MRVVVVVVVVWSLIAACGGRLPPVTSPLQPLEADGYRRPLGEGSHRYPGSPQQHRVRMPAQLAEELTGGDDRGAPAIRWLALRRWAELDDATHFDHVLSLSGPVSQIPRAARLAGSVGELTITLSQDHHTLTLPAGELRCMRAIVEDVRFVVGGVELQSREHQSLEPLGGPCAAPIADYVKPQWFSLGITSGAPVCARIEVARGAVIVWAGHACGMTAPHDAGQPRQASGPIQRGDRVRVSYDRPEYCTDESCRERWRFANWHGVTLETCPCSGTEACTFTVGDAAAYTCIATWAPIVSARRAR